MTPVGATTIVLPEGLTLDDLPKRVRYAVTTLAGKTRPWGRIGEQTTVAAWDTLKVEVQQFAPRTDFKAWDAETGTFGEIAVAYWTVQAERETDSLAGQWQSASWLVPAKGRTRFGSWWRSGMLGKSRQGKRERDYFIWAGI